MYFYFKVCIALYLLNFVTHLKYYSLKYVHAIKMKLLNDCNNVMRQKVL